MILGMAGNSGTQSLAITIRQISERREKSGAGRILKESGIGALNGLLLGAVSVPVVAAFLILGNGFAAGAAFNVGLVVGLSMLLAITLAGTLGAALPLLLKRIGVDPAVASGPFITTFNDVVAVAIYYGLCFLFLSV